MSISRKNFSKKHESEQENPPLYFGAKRFYYQYSVSIPQIHLILISILQGIAFGALLLKFPIPPTLKDFFIDSRNHYFYIPYILSSILIIIAWMDFVYASAVLIWPASAFLAGLIYLLTLFEVGMATTIENFPLWRSMFGLVAIVGGILRYNNWRIFKKEDFENEDLGAIILRNELIYGVVYIFLGALGLTVGLTYDSLVLWLQGIMHQSSIELLVRWFMYTFIFIELSTILAIDISYRQYILRKITEKTDLDVSPHGIVRHKKNEQDQKQIEEYAEEYAKEETKFGSRKRMYYLWEKGHWSALSIDFTQDKTDWSLMLTNEQRIAIRFLAALFLNGEKVVTTTLSPFINAASLHEDQVFLATQIADEARHHVFFNRFLQEVIGMDNDMSSNIDRTQSYLSLGYKQIFAELTRITNHLRQHPHDKATLTQAIVLYHIITEGLAHVGQHFLLTFGRNTQLLPGFMKGIEFISRDESRHMAFGLLWLRELIETSAECRVSAVKALNRSLPWVSNVFFPPELDLSYMDSFGISEKETCIFIMRLIYTRIKYLGISPNEIIPLIKLGHTDSPEVLAERILTLMKSGILNATGTLHVTEDAMDIIFISICNMLAWGQVKHKGSDIIIQWYFKEAKPRYLRIGKDSEVSMGIGSIANPHLVLEVTAANWTHIVSGRLNPLQAILTRYLRVKGDWKLALRLVYVLSRQN